MANEGLRERKKRETRIALSWAAVRLVAERGFDAVRVEDIAAEAGVSLRTFRNYFGSKAEAVAARHVERVEAITAELGDRPESEPLWEAIGAAFESGFALGASGHGGSTPPDEEWVSGVRLMMSQPALRGAMAKASADAESALVSVVAERTGTTGLYPRLVAAVLGSAVAAAIEEWVHADPPVPVADLLTAALDQVRAGLPEPSPPGSTR